MSIFSPLEEFLTAAAEQAETAAKETQAAMEQVEVMKPQEAEFTPEQLEAQEAMKELPATNTEQLGEMKQLSREEAMHKAWEEYTCFGKSAQLSKMLEESGISIEELQEYSTEKLLKKADALIESSRALLKDERNVSFGESVEARTRRHAMENAAKDGNKIALEHRTNDYVKQLEKEAQKKVEADAKKKAEADAKKAAKQAKK